MTEERLLRIQKRDEHIRELRAKGIKRATIARLVGASPSTVDEAIYRLRPSARREVKS